MSTSSPEPRDSPLRFAVIGAGFWANYQLAAWHALSEGATGSASAAAKCVAVCDRDRGKAQALADRFNIKAVYDDAEKMLASERLDFVDIISEVDSHVLLAKLAAKHGVPAICQKPLATSY